MKKLLAILLVIVMVLPMAFTVSAAESTEVAPFYFVNMGGLAYESEYDYCYDMPFFWSPEPKKGQPVHVAYDGANADTIPTIAAALKKTFDAQPEGSRYIRFDLPHKVFNPLSENVVYTQPAKEAIKGWFSEFIEEYHSIGGKIDGVVIDLEYENIESYYLYKRVYAQDKEIYQKIVEHPLYETWLRPMLVERGFKFYSPATEATPEIWGITGMAGKGYETCQSVWDTVTRNILSKDLTEAVYEPLIKYYPDGHVSDYQTRSTYNWLKTTSDYGNTGVSAGGNIVAAGNSSNFNFYSYRPTLGYYQNSQSNEPTYQIPIGFNGGNYENSPFHMFLWDANTFKDMYQAANGYGLSVWLGNYNYNKDNPLSSSNTPYYAETILHMGLLNPKPFQGYIVTSNFEDILDEETEEFITVSDQVHYAVQVVDDILAELTRVVGAADRKPIAIPTRWNDSFVLSGMTAGGKNIWRLTPDTTQVSLEDFKVAGDELKFSVNGKTIIFPQGKIIEDGKVREVGTCGYWIETPTDVTPVITVEDNFYSKYPTFTETYEQYENGTEYKYDTICPVASWQVKKSSDSTAVVQDKDGNNVLALTGTYTLRNINLPKNVIAGDTYAEHQAWEVTVTVPANMAADAEVIVLNCIGQRPKSSDGGVKIAGGKLYYDKAGEYVELEGIDLSAGGTVTVRREVDFSDAEALKCHYTVFDAQGNVLGRVKDVPMVELALPITIVCIGVSKVAGDPVLFDNYKLYLTKVAADFELYDANTGLVVTELDKARDADTAYRVSWVNATRTEKTYSVVAAYYEGDKLVSEKVVQEIKMAPGTDGVDTAIVENEEGKSLLVYLRNDSPADSDEDETPITPGGNDNKPIQKPGAATEPEGLNLLTVIVVILAALSVEGLVLLILATSKPKKKAKKTTKTVKPKKDTAE